MQLSVKNALITLTDTEDLTTKGKHFKSRFILPGLAGYPGQFGNALIKKENLDRFVHTLRNKPVTIKHKDNITDIDKKGEVFNVWYNPEDGWYWCDGIITDPEAVNLINSGWSVSCAYDYTACDNTGGTLNNIPYDIEFLDGEFNHLALVNNPRYEGANIVFNSKVDNEDKWITVKPNGEENKGRHLLIKEGESVEDAMHRNGWFSKRQAKEDKKEDKNKYLKKGELETDKVYKLGSIYVKPFIDEDGDLAFYNKTGAWGEGSLPQKFLKSDLKNIERVEKYDKLTDKELKFLSEKGDFKQKETNEENFEKETKTTKKDEGRHQKIRDLEDKAYKEFKTMYDNYINGAVKISDFGKAKESNVELDKKDWEYISTQPQEKQQAIIDALKSKKIAEIESEKARQREIKKENEKLAEEKKKREKDILDKYEKGKALSREKAKKMTLEEYLTSKGVKARKGANYELHKYDWEQAQNSLTDTILNAISDMIQGK